MRTNRDNKNYDGEIKLSDIETRSGVYFLYNNDDLVYIGKANNIMRRLMDHIVDGEKFFTHIKYQVLPIDAIDQVETFLIKTMQPPLNMKEVSITSYRNKNSNSVITIAPTVNYMKRDGTHTIKIRVVYRQKSFCVPTNMVAYTKDISGSRIINKEILDDCEIIVKPLRDAIKYIPHDKSFEFVRKTLRKIAI